MDAPDHGNMPWLYAMSLAQSQRRKNMMLQAFVIALLRRRRRRRLRRASTMEGEPDMINALRELEHALGPGVLEGELEAETARVLAAEERIEMAPTKRKAPLPEPESSVASSAVHPRRVDGTRAQKQPRNGGRAGWESVYGERVSLDGIKACFERDGVIVLRDCFDERELGALSKECRAVLRNYARRRGDEYHEYPTRLPRGGEGDRATPTESASAFSWMCDDFGCVFEIAGCCDCAPPPGATRPTLRDGTDGRTDPRSFPHRYPCELASAPASGEAGAATTGANDDVARCVARCLERLATTAERLMTGESRTDARPRDLESILESILATPSGSNDDGETPHVPNPRVHVLNDQYIVKPPGARDGKTRFAWHRDGQYRDDTCPTSATRTSDTRPSAAVSSSYLSAWTALDDVDESNGALRVLPYPRGGDAAGHRARARLYEHSPDELDALDALSGDADVEEERRHAFKRARRMAMRAGDVLFMSAEVLHCSGPNGSGRFRRAWMPQFSLATPAGGGDGAV